MAIPTRHKPATNTAAVNTISAVTNSYVEIDKICWSYSAAPTGGNLKIESPSGTTVFEVDVTAAGPGSIEFPSGCRFTKDAAVIVTLAAGGSGIQGIVNTVTRQ